jgi:ferrous iron transport protein B
MSSTAQREAGRAADPATLTVALLGNPNTGKTSLFNALTGLAHQVGNYPGVTVERKVGVVRHEGRSARVLDLPGTYSLGARSPDELVAVDVLLGQQAGEQPVDVVVAIVDASNLQRNLYLASQVLELGVPVVVVLTMMDVARRRGAAVDPDELSQRLGVPVVSVRADRRQGMEALTRTIFAAAGQGPPPAGDRPVFPTELEQAVDQVHGYLRERQHLLGREVKRPEAFRALVDCEGETARRLAVQLGADFYDLLDGIRREVGGCRPLAALEAGARYAWIDALADAVLREPAQRVRTLSDRIDAVLTHRVWGTLTLALVLALVFQAIYSWSGPLMDLIEIGTDALATTAASGLQPGPLRSLVIDGMIGGVGSVIIFLPQILLLFFFIALLEDCGYMARAAFLMDKLLSKLGLSGQSVIPLLSSFACAVPGVMSARAISDRRDRLATILVAPLMSCSARLPVYVLMIGAFVPAHAWLGGWVGLRGLTLFAAHVVGILVAIPVLWIAKRTLLRGPVPAFVLELPSYKWPNGRAVFTRIFMQGKEFVLRAGTVILAFTVIVWALSYFPRPDAIHEHYETLRAEAPTAEARAALDRAEQAAYLHQSVFGRIGRWIEPAVEPLGWDWRIGIAAAASIPAREVVIATLGTILGVGGEVDESSDDLVSTLRDARRATGAPLFSLPVALSLVVFFALCCQCASTLVVIRRETGSWGWPALTFGYMTALAYIGALITYQLAAGILS